MGARTYHACVKYPDEARSLWQTSVPRSGLAATVQGELLRAVEKLRDEAQRNGNINWNQDHQALIAYLRDTLPMRRNGHANAVLSCRDERLAQRASWLWWVAACEGVGAAEGIGQPVVACHVADHVRGVVAGHPGGCDIQRAAGVTPA